MERYVKVEANDAESKAFASKYLALKTENSEAYSSLTKDLKDTPLYLLIAHWQHQQFPGHYSADMELADSYSKFGVYGAVLKILSDQGKRLDLSPAEQCGLEFRRAWALQQCGEGQEAMGAWKLLVDCDDLYTKSAACWFLGKNLEKSHQVKEALAYYKKVSGNSSKSKYANYCLNAQNRLQNK